MSNLMRVLLFFILPLIATLVYPPEMLINGIQVLVFVLAFFIFLGWLLYRGRSLALTLSIFIQGLNVIIRLMMLYSNAYNNATGQFNLLYAITAVIGMALSMYLLLRLDKSDVRVTMIV